MGVEEEELREELEETRLALKKQERKALQLAEELKSCKAKSLAAVSKKPKGTKRRFAWPGMLTYFLVSVPVLFPSNSNVLWYVYNL